MFRYIKKGDTIHTNEQATAAPIPTAKHIHEVIVQETNIQATPGAINEPQKPDDATAFHNRIIDERPAEPVQNDLAQTAMGKSPGDHAMKGGYEYAKKRYGE